MASVGGGAVAVVISTGLIAVLALPAREGVQRLIDRVFFRNRYDLERSLESFEARLQDRDWMELVGTDLLQRGFRRVRTRACGIVGPEVRR